MPFIETVYDHMPKLKAFDPGNPPDVNTLNLTLAYFRPKDPNDPGDADLYCYTNGYYNFALDELQLARTNNNEILVFHQSGKGLFRIGSAALAGIRPPHPNKYWIDVKPPKGTLHEDSLLDDNETERLILIKSLLDLNGITMEKYGLQVLDDASLARFRRRLSAAVP